MKKITNIHILYSIILQADNFSEKWYFPSSMLPWRNWLARSAVNRKVGGSSPPGSVESFLYSVDYINVVRTSMWWSRLQKLNDIKNKYKSVLDQIINSNYHEKMPLNFQNLIIAVAKDEVGETYINLVLFDWNDNEFLE